MSEVLFFLIGMMLGGCASFILLCCIQLNRVCEYEKEIHRLKKMLSQERKSEIQLK